MKMTAMFAMLGLVLSASVVHAGDVNVKGVHLCCGACVRDVDKALKEVTGVSDAACDRDAMTVTFKATDDKAAAAGVKALAKAGFHGKAKHDDKAVKFPASGAKKNAKADSVTINEVHLCCGGCVKAAEKAVKEAAADAEVKIDRDERTVSLTGNDLDVNAIIKELNKSGLHGTVK